MVRCEFCSDDCHYHFNKYLLLQFRKWYKNRINEWNVPFKTCENNTKIWSQPKWNIFVAFLEVLHHLKTFFKLMNGDPFLKLENAYFFYFGWKKCWIENCINVVPLTVVVISNYLLCSVMIIKSSLIHQYLPSQTSHMGTNVGIVHFIEPIRRGAEGALINENYRCDWTSLLWLEPGPEPELEVTWL